MVVTWFLNLFSDAAKSQLKTERIVTAIRGEAEELRLSAALNVFVIEFRWGQFESGLLEWIMPILRSYNGQHSSNMPRMIAEMERAYAAGAFLEGFYKVIEEAQPRRDMRLQPFALPILDANIGEMPSFSPALRSNLLELRRQVGFFNGDVATIERFLNLPGGTQKQLGPVDDANLKATYRSAHGRSRRIADHIGTIAWT